MVPCTGSSRAPVLTSAPLGRPVVQQCRRAQRPDLHVQGSLPWGGAQTDAHPAPCHTMTSGQSQRTSQLHRQFGPWFLDTGFHVVRYMRRALSRGPPDPLPAPDRRLKGRQLQEGVDGAPQSWKGLHPGKAARTQTHGRLATLGTLNLHSGEASVGSRASGVKAAERPPVE